MKVYCCNCEHVIGEVGLVAPMYILCRKHQIDTPLRIEYKQCISINTENNCGDFEEEL